MSLPVVLRPEATKDAVEAIGYFNALRPGLGQAFLIQVQDVLLRISGMPEIHGIVWRNVRAARLRRFTYVVYYRVHAEIEQHLFCKWRFSEVGHLASMFR